MAIDKGITVAPKGIDEAALEEEVQELEIEIVNPEMVTLDDGSVEITLIPDAPSMGEISFDGNIATILDDSELGKISDEVVGLVEADVDSRKEWAETFAKGLDILGFNYEERTTPWEGACGVHSTVLAEAAIRFQAETMSETFPAGGPVRVKVLGKETPDKVEAAERVRSDMNYQLTERMVEYRPEHERMLYSLGLAGSAFKKVYMDENIGRQVAIYIPAEDVIVPYGASTIEFAERVTHVMRKTKNELRRLQVMGFYRDVDLGDPSPYHSDIEEKKAEDSGYSITDDDRYSLYEAHLNLFIESIDDDEEEIAKPYVVTLERGSGEILAIRRNWNPDDPLMLKRQHFVHYSYVPGFGFYGLGLIHIIGGYAKAGTSLIRQLVDAGTLANLPGGLKSRGLRIKGDDEPIEPGEFKDVDVPSGSIRENIMPLPYKEPSQTLLALLNQITTEGRRLGAISDINVSDMSANAPVGTTLALLERTLKPMAAVQARVHYAMKQEFKLLKKIISDYSEDYDYNPQNGEMSAKMADYMSTDVIPVSDPNSSTMAQRVVQYQAVLQMAQQAPQIYNLPQLHRQMIEVLGIKNAEKLIPVEDDLKPVDPVSENMNAVMSKPMKAFIQQDHDAHIASHVAFTQDPIVGTLLQQNPRAKQIMASLQAHIAEHLAFKYRNDIEKQIGATLPLPDEELPDLLAADIAKLVAEASVQLKDLNQKEAAQKQAMAKAQDPVVQLQKADMQIKQAEVQRKAQKDQTDARIKQAELQLKAQKTQADTQLDAARLKLDEDEMMLEAKKDGIKLAQDRRRDNTKLDIEAANIVTRGKQGGS